MFIFMFEIKIINDTYICFYLIQSPCFFKSSLNKLEIKTFIIFLKQIRISHLNIKQHVFLFFYVSSIVSVLGYSERKKKEMDLDCRKLKYKL